MKKLSMIAMAALLQDGGSRVTCIPMIILVAASLTKYRVGLPTMALRSF